jgi:diguanylate cyclase (GGDEF)-like protein
MAAVESLRSPAVNNARPRRRCRRANFRFAGHGRYQTEARPRACSVSDARAFTISMPNAVASTPQESSPARAAGRLDRVTLALARHALPAMWSAIVLGFAGAAMVIYGAAEPDRVAKVVAVLLLCAGAIGHLIIARSRRLDSRHLALESRYRALVDQASDGIALIEPASGVVLQGNPSLARLLGADKACEARPPALPQAMRELLTRWHRDPAPAAAIRSELILADTQGVPHQLGVALTRVIVDGQALALLVLRDIAEQKRFEREITHLAFHDSLTGLANRRLLKQRIAELIAASRSGAGEVSLLLLDLDRFKRVNDSLGHAAGDELLRAVAERLRRIIPPHALLARLGGDEFALVCDRYDALETLDLAHTIVASVTEPIAVGSHQLHVGVSVGIARCPDHASNLEGMLRAADVAMYQAKTRGGGVAVFDSDADSFSAEMLETESALREAMLARAFTLEFQPVLAPADRSVLLWEALVRWPYKGEVLTAGRFMPLIEDLGLCSKLDEVVFDLVADQLRNWDAAGFNPRVSVNLSAGSLLRIESVAAFERAVLRLGSLASSLVIEVTETSLIEDWAAVGAALARLRRYGVGVAVDDFGNGYASIAYLRQLPADILKLDRSLVVSLGRADGEQRLVRALIQLGRAMGLSVIAEGVETRLQNDQLRQLGCELIQGYLIARPMAPAQALAWNAFGEAQSGRDVA